MSQDPPALAAAVVAVLSEALETDTAESPAHTDVVVIPRLVIRASTAPPARP